MKFSFKEFHLFIVAVLVFISPLIFSGGVHTIDGSAHVYNANIILNLIFGDGFYSSFFESNSYPVPNWGGHVLLVLLDSIFNDFYANQIFIFLLIIGLPFSFRYFLSSFKGNNYKLYSYLSIPFGLSSMLVLGFYNFLLGLIHSFFVIGFWKNQSSHEMNWKSILLFNFLFCFVFFSHAFAFIFMAIMLFFLFIKRKKSLLSLIPSFGLSAIFFLIYFLNKDNGALEFMSKQELVKWLLELRTLVLFDLKEVSQTSLISLSFLLLFVITVMNRLYLLFKTRTPLKFGIENILLVIFFLLYLFAPHSDGFGSYISDRLLLIFMLILILWLSFQKQLNVFIPIVFTVLIYGQSLFLNINRMNQFEYQNKQVNEIFEISSFIKENRTVYPIRSHSNHVMGHFSNYLSFDKNVLVLENYEARQGYFPLKWNWSQLPQFKLGSHEIKIDNYTTKNMDIKAIDYVIIYTDNLEKALDNHSDIKVQLDEKYSIVHQTDNLVLFEVN